MSTARTTARSAPTGAATESTKVRRLVSGATLALLLMLTIASVANIRDMAEATHAADGLASLLVAVAIGGTLSVLAYVASITDGSTRTLAASFATFAAIVSTSLQVSLFLERGAGWPVALAFGAGVPFFEIALALTDSMLRRYVEPVTVQNTVNHAAPDTVQNSAPDTVQNTVNPAAPDTVQNAKPVIVQNSARDTGRKVNVTQLAKQMGVSRTTVYRMLNSGELQLNGTGD